MWKAAFSGRSEGVGSSTGRLSEPRRKRSHRAESVTSSTSRRPQEDEKVRERDRRRSGRSGSVYGDDSEYATPSSSRAGPHASSSSSANPLTASALRMLPNDDDDWEDENDAKSERKSSRGNDSEKRRKSSSGKAGWIRERSPSRDKKDKDKKRSVSGSEKISQVKEKDARKPEIASPERSRAMPEMGSFAQFPGQYASGHMGPGRPMSTDAMMSGALPSSAPQQGQFPGQDNNMASFVPSMPSRADSYGQAAEYYQDTGESVQHQPGVRPNSPNMLVNPDLHLVSASSEPQPVADTGNGAAAEFYSGSFNDGMGLSASAPVTPAGRPKPSKPGKQSSWSASKPSKTSRPSTSSKPSKSSTSGAAAAALAGAAGIAALSTHSSSAATFQQGINNSSSNEPNSVQSRPSRHDSDGKVYYGPPPQSHALNGVSELPSYTYGVPGSASAYVTAQSTNNSYATAQTYQGKQSGNSSIPLYAAGAAAAGLAAYEIKQHYQQDSHSMASGVGLGGSRPPGGSGGNYPSNVSGIGTGMNQMHQHEHKGPMTRLKDGLLNLISSPEDTAKMEMYTEYIGVCKYCFDPRTSAWDAPRVHHYHKRRDSFEDLRRRKSNERLYRKGSNDSLRRVRVDKDNRYYASDSSRKRRESGKRVDILGAGLAAAGVATAANAMFGGKDFDDTYSVKSGHREHSAMRMRSRSSSREQRRRTSYGVARADKQEFVTVRRKDGTTERRKVGRSSRSTSGERRSSGLYDLAAGAAIGAGAVAAASSSRRSRSSSRSFVGRRANRRPSARSSYSREDRAEQTGGIFSGFFSPSQNKRRDSRERKEHRKKNRGFFTFSNGSASSTNSELAFGDTFASKTSLPLSRRSSARSTARRGRRKSDEHIAATIAGIGATAAALAAAQRSSRINKRPSKIELGAKRDAYRVSRDGRRIRCADEEEWEDELPSDADNISSDEHLAFGELDGRRLSARQSLESITSQSSAGGLGAWGWRWGGKDKKRRSRVPDSRASGSRPPPYPPSMPPPSYPSSMPTTSYPPSMAESHFDDAAYATAHDVKSANSPYTAEPVTYVDETGRRLPSTASSYPSSPIQPMQYVDPQPYSDADSLAGSRHGSMPGGFEDESASSHRPGPAPLQQPQPTTPIRTAFTHDDRDEAHSDWSRPSPRRANSSPARGTFAQDAAIIGAGALATAGIIAAASSGGRKSRGEASNVRFGLTEEQQRKEDRDRRREDEDRRRADRTRALKEEAERAARESRQEEIRRAREDENRRAAEAELERQRAVASREAEHRAEIDRQRAEQDAFDRHAREQQQRRIQEDAYRREQARIVEEARLQEEKREALERERFQRQQRDVKNEGELEQAPVVSEAVDTAPQRNAEESKRDSRGSVSDRSRKESEHDMSSPNSSWGFVAAGVAAATIGAAIASKDREASRTHDQSNESYDPYVKEVTPQNAHDGEPLMDDDIYDPNFFRKKHTPAESARYEDLARKAAVKVASDREIAYNDHSTYAEFFAPKDVFSEPSEDKTKVMGPNADNDIQVYRATDSDVLSRLHRSMSGELPGKSRYAPYGVPKLTVMSPTPPRETTSPSRARGSDASSPLSKACSVDDDVEDIAPDDTVERSRSISWGEDKTHIYDAQTPESYVEKDRDSFFPSPDRSTAGVIVGVSAGAAIAGAALHEAVVNGTSGSKSKTDKYGDEECNKHDEGDKPFERPGPSSFSQQPPFGSVSSMGPEVDSPGNEGTPPVRDFNEGEVKEPTTAEEKAPHMPGGFDDDNDDIYRPRPARNSASFETSTNDKATSIRAERESPIEEPAWSPPLSKKEQKKRDKEARRESLVDTDFEQAARDAEPEPAWEPPLSKKEQKKRDKAAKRSSIVGEEPVSATSPIQGAAIEPLKPTEDPVAEEEPEEFFMSKKDKKKRDKAKKQGFADLVSSIDSLSRNKEDSQPSQERTPEQSADTRNVPPLSKKEQKKLDKQAKKSGLVGFADVAETILAAGGVAAAAAELQDDDDWSQTASSKKKDKKGKKPKLGEPLDRDIRDVEPQSPSSAEQSGMPGGWDSEKEPSRKGSEGEVPGSFDPFQYQVHENDDTTPAAPEPPSAQGADPWTEFSEPKKSKKKSKRNSTAFNVPEVSSPLRTEMAWDKIGETEHNTNGNGNDQALHTEQSQIPTFGATPTPEKGRQSDYFAETEDRPSGTLRRRSPEDSRSVASAPTPLSESDGRSRRAEVRDGGDYFDQPSYAYETQSTAASEPVDLYESSKKSKRRSRHEDDEPRRSKRDDDDDRRSVASSRSRRDKDESPPSNKKEKKTSILGSLFGRKSEGAPLSRETTRESKTSRADDNEEDRPRRKKKHRDSQAGFDENDDARSVKSDSRHRRRRSEAGDLDDDQERRRRSTPDDEHNRDGSESGRRHHRRRRTGETEDESLSRHTSHSSPDDSEKRPHHHRRKTDEEASVFEDQSFLGMRVEEMPPLPVEIPVAIIGSVADNKNVRELGSPVQTEQDPGMVNSDTVLPKDSYEEQDSSAILSPKTPLSGTRPTSRGGSSTAVPLRFPFGHAPSSPLATSAKERSHSFHVAASPTVLSPSPTFNRKSRQDRPRSTEIKPLYLVERNRKTPEVEDALPSLPSSKPSSRASSAHSDEFESAVEDIPTSPATARALFIDTSKAAEWNADNRDVLGSGETTPKASEGPSALLRSGAERHHSKEQPQFYTWEDYAREQRRSVVEEELPPLPESRSISPVKRDRSRSSSFKTVAAAAMLGAAAVYAAQKISKVPPEHARAADDSDRTAPPQAQVGPLPAPKDDMGDDNKPLSLRSSTKREGTKDENCQPYDNGRDIETPPAAAMETLAKVLGDAFRPIFASAAAHTLPVYDLSKLSSAAHEDPQDSNISRSSTATRMPSPEQDRPVTSYRLPTAKAGPAHLVLEERIAVEKGHGGHSEPADITTTPRLTRQHTESPNESQRSIAPWGGPGSSEPAMVGEDKDQSLIVDNSATADQVAAGGQDCVALPSVSASPAATASHANFDLSDFSNVAHGSGIAWQDSQAQAFENAMLAAAASEDTSSAKEDSQTLREPPITELQEEQGLDFAPVSSKKKSKKDKKKRVSIWSEPGEEPEAVAAEPESNKIPELNTNSLEEPSRDEPAAENVSATDEIFMPSSSKKKSKKDKKKNWFAWDEPEVEETPVVEPILGVHDNASADASTGAERTYKDAPSAEVVSAADDIASPASSKKKFKKDKKKKSFAWAEPDDNTVMDNEMNIGQPDQSMIENSAEPQPEDDFFAPVTSKKSEKDQNRQSSLHETAEEAVAPGLTDVQPDQSSESTHDEQKEQISSAEFPAGAAIVLAAGTLAAAVDGSSLAQDSAAQAEDEDLATISKKNGKNGKNESQLDWSETGQASIAKDELVPAADDFSNDTVWSVPERQGSLQELNNETQDVQTAEDDTALPREDPVGVSVAEPAVKQMFTSSISRKQSKKDKKKKNRQSQAWEPEPKPESETQPELTAISAIPDAEELQEPPEAPLLADQAFEPAEFQRTAEGPDAAAGDMTAPAQDDHFRDGLTRKQSKKDKKNRQRLISLRPDPDSGSQADRETVGDRSEPVPSQDQGETSRALEPDSIAEEVPLPPDDDHELQEKVVPEIVEDASNVPLPEDDRDKLAVIPEVVASDTVNESLDLEAAREDKLGSTELSARRDPGEDAAAEFSGDEFAAQLPGPLISGGETKSATAGERETADEFFSPADPSIEEPSRLTEDLDAFGDLDKAAVDRENRRAAREAAEASALAEASRMRPQDESYAALMAARKPAGGKKGKKSRKSITSVVQNEPSGVQTSTFEEMSTVDAATPAAIADDDGVIAEKEGNTQDEPPAVDSTPDDLDWAPSSKKKSKKGKKGASGNTTTAASDAVEPTFQAVRAVVLEDTAKTSAVDPPSDDWAAPVKGEKAKKGKKNKLDWTEQLGTTTPDTTATDTAVPDAATPDTAAPDATAPEMTTRSPETGLSSGEGASFQDDSPEALTTTVSSREPASEADDAIPPSTEQSSPLDSIENAASAEQAGVTDPAEASMISHCADSTLVESRSSEGALVAKGEFADAEPRTAVPEEEDWTPLSPSNPSKSKKTKLNDDLQSFSDGQDRSAQDKADVEIAQAPLTATDLEATTEIANDASVAFPDEPAIDEWPNFSIKKSKKDKKKAKKNLRSALFETEQEQNDKTQTGVTEGREEPMQDESPKNEQLAHDEPIAEKASTMVPDENAVDDRPGFAVKKSEKDKKKAKNNSEPPPFEIETEPEKNEAATIDKSDLVRESAMTSEQSISILEDPAPEVKPVPESDEQIEDDWGGFAVKKSKKDKKKAKKGVLSADLNTNDRRDLGTSKTAHEPSTEEEQPKIDRLSTDNAPAIAQHEHLDGDWGSFAAIKSKNDEKTVKQRAASPDNAGLSLNASKALDDILPQDPLDDIDVPGAWVETPAAGPKPLEEDWAGFVTDKSKKDKKKAKKSDTSTPKHPDGNDLLQSSQDDYFAVQPGKTVAEKQESLPTSLDPVSPIAAAASFTIERDKSSDVILDDAAAADGSVEPTSPKDSSQDIDFAATLAAGLAGTGFDPDMVISDPAFHRRASPPGDPAEADPEEILYTTTSKRKKGKVENSLDAPISPTESKVPTPTSNTEALLPNDDFNQTINQSLSGAGFDPSLLEKALSSDHEASSREAQDGPAEVSFTTTKRKKGKKGKKIQLEEDAAVDSRSLPAPGEEDVLLGAERSLDDPVLATEPATPLDYHDPAGALLASGGEMDVDDMDKAYRAYKKNKRLQKKLKAAGNLKGSPPDTGNTTQDETERSAVVSALEVVAPIATIDMISGSTLPVTSLTMPASLVQSTSPSLEDKISTSSSEDHPSSQSGREGILLTDERSQSLPAALIEDASSEEPPEHLSTSHPQSGTMRAIETDPPAWSFAHLQDNTSTAPDDTDTSRGGEYQMIRNNGYDQAQRSLEQTPRSSREVPPIVRQSSSQESLRNRRSLEPLHISTGSTLDEDKAHLTPAKQSDPNGSTGVGGDTPLMPSTKERTSYLFQSPPEGFSERPERLEHSNADGSTPSKNKNDDDYFGSSRPQYREIPSEDTRERAFSPSNNLLSPRTPLRPIQEEFHAVKRSKAATDDGGSGRAKAIDRTPTPRSIRARELGLLPSDGLSALVSGHTARGAINPLSTDDLIHRLSCPAVDEDNDAVNIDRSLVLTAMSHDDDYSSSVVSNRLNGHTGMHQRPSEQNRSFSRGSNHSNQSSSPSLRRTHLSGDLRAVSRAGSAVAADATSRSSNMAPFFEAPPTPPLNDDELDVVSASGAAGNMNDVFVSAEHYVDQFDGANHAQSGYGDAARSQTSPTRPPSVRKRQSMHINDLESRLESLVAENKALQEARSIKNVSMGAGDSTLQDALNARDVQLQEKDAEINQIKAMLQPLQEEIARLTQTNNDLSEANRNLVDDTNGRYATLQAEHAATHEQWQSTSRDLQSIQQEHGRITSGMKDILEAEIASALADKNSEILRLREQLDIATEQIRALQVQIQSSNSSDFLVQRDEDYFDGSCQKLCQHVQQWVLRFSKLSDNRICRLSTELNDDKIEARLDNAVLDGSDVDKLLGDRVRRRDVFMSVVMTMVWEYIFTRYLFGMDREQRQKLKTLEKLLSEVGPPRAVAHWRATTLTLLSKRPNFSTQCTMDTEAVAHEIFTVLGTLLPPPPSSSQQLLTSLQRVIAIAVDLAIEMRTQRAEYIMLPPLQPEYDAQGDLVRKIHFNASLMNERSGFFHSNEDLAREHAVVKIVLFPLVVKKGDDVGEGEEEIVVCPAQVLVQNEGREKGRKIVRVQSGAIAMDVDEYYPGRTRSGMSGRRSVMSEGMGGSEGMM